MSDYEYFKNWYFIDVDHGYWPIGNQESLDPEFIEFVSQHFWELI